MEKFKNILATIKNPGIFFLLASLFFGWEYFILGPWSYARTCDILDSFTVKAVVSWKTLFAGGALSGWLPEFAGGMDRLSNAASFSDLGNLLFIFPGWLALALIIIGGIFIGGFYTYRLGHEIFGWGKKASAVTGVLFSYFFVVADLPQYIFGLAIMPLALFYLEKVFLNQKIRAWLKAVLFVFLGLIYAIFSPLITTLPFVSVGIVLWFIFIRKQKSLLFYALLVLFFLPAALLKIPEAAALLLNTPLSERGAGALYFKAGIKHYLVAVKSIFRDDFPILLASLLGLFSARRDKLFWKLFSLILFFTFIPPLYTNFFVASPAVSVLGPFRNFDFSRFTLLIPFFAALAAGVALEKTVGLNLCVSSPDGKSRQFKLNNILVGACLVVVLFFSLVIKLNHAQAWLKNGSYRANVYSPDIAAVAEKSTDEALFRVASFAQRPVNKFLPSLVNFQGLESIDDYVNVGSRRAVDVFRLMAKDETVKSNRNFLMNYNNQTASVPPTQAVNMNLLSLANTRFIVTDAEIDSPDLKLVPTPSAENWQGLDEMNEMQKLKFWLKQNFTGRKLLVYENNIFFPRFFLAGKIKVFASDAELLEEMAKADLPALRENVFLNKIYADNLSEFIGDADDMAGESASNPPSHSFGGQGEKIEVVEYSNDRIKLKVESGGPAVLVASNNYSPFWEAYVNGEKTEIMPADHAFWGVFLKATSSEIEFDYNPQYKLGSL